ncbi:MAG: DUF3052 domain-containing protein [Chloroflexi bacterium]|nr:DUF3052 domain-containing protein [Chloroflexota bacterium]
MSDKSIAEKLLIKAGRSIYVVNAPRGYATRLVPLPDGVKRVKTPTAPVDLIQVFVANRAELEAQLPALKPWLAPGGLLWVTYTKGTSKIKTDIHRDTINAYAATLGLQGVAMISIDEDWSALRLKVM